MSRNILIKATCRDKKGKIISTAHNNYRRTHPVQAYFARLAGQNERQYLHAEILALLRCKDKKPYSIEVERYHKNGEPALAAPCPVCVKAIKAWGVQRVTYTV